MSSFITPSRTALENMAERRRRPETEQERRIRLARERSAASLDSLTPRPRVSQEELRRGFPLPARREEEVRRMGPPTPAQSMGPMPQRPSVGRPQDFRPGGATSSQPQPRQPQPSVGPAANFNPRGPQSPQPPQPARPASDTNPLTGQPRGWVGQQAQDFRTRVAERDRQLTEMGIDGPAAREQLARSRREFTGSGFGTPFGDPRALRQRAIALRARGNTEAANRLIEQAVASERGQQDLALQSQVMRNPERAQQLPQTAANIRIAQERARRMREVQGAEFEAGAVARENMAGTLVEGTTGDLVRTRTDRRIAEGTEDTRVQGAVVGSESDVSEQRLRGERAEAASRILNATTDVSVEQLSQDLDALMATAEPNQQAQIQEAMNRWQQARTVGEQIANFRALQQVVSQIQQTAAEGEAARQPIVEETRDIEARGARDAAGVRAGAAPEIARAESEASLAGLDAQTAAARLATMEADMQRERLAELEPAQRQAIAAQLATTAAQAEAEGDAARAQSARSALDLMRSEAFAESGLVDQSVQNEIGQERIALNQQSRDIRRAQQLQRLGVNVDDPNEVRMGNELVNGGIDRIFRVAANDFQSGQVNAETIAELNFAVDALRWLDRNSNMTPEEKRQIAAQIQPETIGVIEGLGRVFTNRMATMLGQGEGRRTVATADVNLPIDLIQMRRINNRIRDAQQALRRINTE